MGVPVGGWWFFVSRRGDKGFGFPVCGKGFRLRAGSYGGCCFVVWTVRFASLNGTLRRRWLGSGPGACAGAGGCQRPGMVERRSIADLLGLRQAVVDAEDDQDEFAGDSQERRAENDDRYASPDHGLVGIPAAGGSGNDAAAPDDEDQRADPKGDLDERWGGESSEGEEVAEGVYARFGGR